MSNETDPTGADSDIDTSAAVGTSRFALPSAYTILFGLIVIMAICTWIIPAGRYARLHIGERGIASCAHMVKHPTRLLRHLASGEPGPGDIAIDSAGIRPLGP